MVETIICPGCGKFMPDTNKFCSRDCCLKKAGLTEDDPVSKAVEVLGY